MLVLVATPIGNPKDITLRALEVLQDAEIIIGEERRIASTLLKKLNITEKEIHLLNEHSKPDEVAELVEFCRTKKVALISDCGTPSFYDPGFQLVKLCRQRNIPVSTAPGASSLMTLLSLVAEQVTQFYFAGFLPADNEQRQSRWKQLLTMHSPLVLMDTPYRLHKLLGELESRIGERRILLGLNLTQEQEVILEGSAQDLLKALKNRGIEKAEFILLVYAASKASSPVKVANQQRRRR
jgi:16S rRNA (cytidine1402-2'-O)-methyltransferase